MPNVKKVQNASFKIQNDNLKFKMKIEINSKSEILNPKRNPKF